MVGPAEGGRLLGGSLFYIVVAGFSFSASRGVVKVTGAGVVGGIGVIAPVG